MAQKITCTQCLLTKYDRNADVRAIFRYDVFGDKALAVTARSETYPAYEYEEALKIAKEIGYKYVAIDLEGYRNGSMNEVLTL